ncbi:signal transduction protein [Halobacteriales archaeon SW_6_65_46]|nr:MAG: signal transduction protein [Halobacteriales archaeon SW_6_65_46]
MNVADAMTPRDSLVTSVVPGSRTDVLDRLQDDEFSSIPIVNDETGAFRGLVSREQLIANPDEDQLAMLVEDVPTVGPDAELDAVARRFRDGDQRRLPIVEGDELLGLVTITDIVHAIANSEVAADATADQLMETGVNAVHQATPLTVAERELAFADEPYGVVLDEAGSPTGMLTEVDVLDVARIVEGEESTGDSIADDDDDWKWEAIKAIGSRYLPTRNVQIPAEPVEMFMTDSLITVGQSKSATDTAQLLITEDIEQVPVVSGDTLVGILRDTDLLEALA